MHQSKNKKSLNVNIRQDETKSRFLVDLKPAPASPPVTGANLFSVKTAEKIRPFVPEKFTQAYSANKQNIDNLAIVRVFMLFGKVGVFLWRMFYGLCYSIGYVTVFIIRFIFIFSERFMKPFSSLLQGITSLLSEASPAFKEFSTRLKSRRAPDNQPAEVDDGGLYALRDKDFSFESEQSGLFWKPFKQTVMFSLALLILILPLKAMTFYSSFDLEDIRGRILGASEEGAKDFISASESASTLDFSKATNNFSQAGDNFLKAKKELNEINGVLLKLASLAPNKKIRMASEAENFLDAGKIAADLGNNLTLALSGISSTDVKDKNLKKILDDITNFGSLAVMNAEDLDKIISKINVNNLPEEYSGEFAILSDKTAILKDSLAEFVDLAGELKDFFGMTQDKRYLLVFQNNSELRASGGFIGSFAIIDFHDGKIKNLVTPGGGSYDTEAGLKLKVTAPEPLHLVNPLWHFWDANWWADWPTTARKLEWFYEKSDGSTVDGVISLTPTVLEKILTVIGEMDMTEKYGVNINAENFWLTTQRFAEQKSDITKEPKKIVGDLMTKMIDELPKRLDMKNMIGLLKAGQESLDEKQILFYFNDPVLEERIAGYGWDGSIKKTNRDYLMVVNTNIAGAKTDRKMKEKITHEASIAEDGTVTDTVIIERTHTGLKNEEFSGVRNVDWMRVYVPLGAKLLEANGFRQPDPVYFSNPQAGWMDDPDVYRAEMMSRTDIKTGTKMYEENGYTVFANWSMTDPGETTIIRLTYELPWKMKSKVKDDSWTEKLKATLGLNRADIRTYSLLVQKQPGAQPSEISSAVKVGPQLEQIWKYPKTIKSSSDGWSITDSLNGDKYWAVLLENKSTN